MNKIDERIESLHRYLQDHGIESFDPYDGLTSPLAILFHGGTPLGSRVWQQAVRLTPVNIRWLLGIKRIIHTKAVSDIASAYSLLYKTTGDERYYKPLVSSLLLLKDLRFETEKGWAWGLRFPFATRFVQAGSETPNIFQTINAVHSFLDAYEELDSKEHLAIAERGFAYLRNDLGFIETSGQIQWRYWKGLDVPVYNVNGLMVGLCSRFAHILHDDSLGDLARKTLCFLISGQNEDGSWYYAGDEKGHFIDGFHTGYILEGFCRGSLAGIIEGDERMERGVRFYLDRFFTTEGLPKYYVHSVYPIDGQNVAQAIQTLCFLYRTGHVGKDVIDRCFDRTDHFLWNEKGYYNYKVSKGWKYTTPMHRWVTGPMLLALAHLKSVSDHPR